MRLCILLFPHLSANIPFLSYFTSTLVLPFDPNKRTIFCQRRQTAGSSWQHWLNSAYSLTCLMFNSVVTTNVYNESLLTADEKDMSYLFVHLTVSRHLWKTVNYSVVNLRLFYLSLSINFTCWTDATAASLLLSYLTKCLSLASLFPISHRHIHHLHPRHL